MTSSKTITTAIAFAALAVPSVAGAATWDPAPAPAPSTASASKLVIHQSTVKVGKGGYRHDVVVRTTGGRIVYRASNAKMMQTSGRPDGGVDMIFYRGRINGNNARGTLELVGITPGGSARKAAVVPTDPGSAAVAITRDKAGQLGAILSTPAGSYVVTGTSNTTLKLRRIRGLAGSIDTDALAFDTAGRLVLAARVHDRGWIGGTITAELTPAGALRNLSRSKTFPDDLSLYPLADGRVAVLSYVVDGVEGYDNNQLVGSQNECIPSPASGSVAIRGAGAVTFGSFKQLPALEDSCDVQLPRVTSGPKGEIAILWTALTRDKDFQVSKPDDFRIMGSITAPGAPLGTPQSLAPHAAVSDATYAPDGTLLIAGRDVAAVGEANGDPGDYGQTYSDAFVQSADGQREWTAPSDKLVAPFFAASPQGEPLLLAGGTYYARH